MELVRLKPATKDYIWGGTKLKNIGKECDTDKLAECWELSMHPDGLCKIDSGIDKGKYLKDVITKADLGTNIEKFSFFPILIKLIDANNKLSVQVHPSDEYALREEKSYGKSECWYVLEAEKDAGLYVGFKKDTNREEIGEALRNGTILEMLNFFKVKPGDHFFIEAGTIHAISNGVVVMEIQQNSNLTYRLYDYNRLGNDGKPRELHIEKALNVIDYKAYHQEKNDNTSHLIAKCKYFSSFLYTSKELKGISTDSTSFATMTIIKGFGKVNNLEAKLGDTFFLSTNIFVENSGDFEFILTKVE